MDFNQQGRRISGNAQVLLMSFRDQDRQKFDTVELDKIALSKPVEDVPLLEPKRGRGRPRKNPIEQQSKPVDDVPLLEPKRGRGRPRKNPIEQQSKPVEDVPLLEPKRGRGRPRKNPIEQQSKPANDVPLFQQKRGRGRPRKTVESEIQNKSKENYSLDLKEKLKLLETITNGYREIQRLDKETQKNVEKLCAMIHNSK